MGNERDRRIGEPKVTDEEVAMIHQFVDAGGTYSELADRIAKRLQPRKQGKAGVDRMQQLVALAVAAAHVYREIMGKAIEPMTVAEGNAILHDVARAISKVAAIYGAIHERETPKPLSVWALHGGFRRGATVLRTPDRVEYRRLAVRRDEMRLAIEVLKRAGTRFGRATTE